ncbi:MAG: thiamine phosphate synthase [Acidobacteria bacterium]|nr:thiamine phosphate synthase [Acidobacteriota bacterium]
MPLVLPRFYAIIDRSPEASGRPELSLDEIVRALTGAGVRLIQVRAKQAPPRAGQATSPAVGGASQALLSDTRRILSLAPSGSLVIVNDRADVACLAGAAGVHLGQDDLPVAAARQLLGPDRLIGWSTHNQEQVKAGDALPIDYLAFGPVFPTATKPNAAPVVGLAALRAARALTKKPLVAIGGITPANAAQALEAGADSVAVISGWLVPTKEGLAPPTAGLAAGELAARLEEFRRALGRLD